MTCLFKKRIIWNYYVFIIMQIVITSRICKKYTTLWFIQVLIRQLSEPGFKSLWTFCSGTATRAKFTKASGLTLRTRSGAESVCRMLTHRNTTPRVCKDVLTQTIILTINYPFKMPTRSCSCLTTGSWFLSTDPEQHNTITYNTLRYLHWSQRTCRSKTHNNL